MGVMTTTRAEPVVLPGDVIVRAGPFTCAERDALPDDGRRHELLDGVLLMTPSPVTRHQDVVGRLFLLLSTQVPRWAKVMLAPFDVVLGDRTVLEPDIVVARRSDVTDKNLPAAPLLAIEVLSPSTRLFDLGPKKDLLAEAGCPSYWVVDPAGPELTAWELRDGQYVEVARVAADETWSTEVPFPVTVSPADLLDD
jgi:Uma2 family endonuclease